MSNWRRTASHGMQGLTSIPVKIALFAMVASVHVVVLYWANAPLKQQPHPSAEMSVSFAAPASHPPSTKAQPARVDKQDMAVAEKQAPQLAAAAQQETVLPVAAPAAAEASEPDYKAAYLHNSPPEYPLLARRNGLHGRVVLNVEVLSNGLCGQVSVYSSSGYAVLDEAAMRSVKTWHFVPARHGGSLVDKWFRIPVQFSLKDNA